MSVSINIATQSGKDTGVPPHWIQRSLVFTHKRKCAYTKHYNIKNVILFHIVIILIVIQSVLQQVQSLLKCHFSTNCNLLLHISNFRYPLSINVVQKLLISYSSSYRHFYPSFYFSFNTIRTQFLRNMRTIQLAFLLLIIRTMFLFFLTLCNIHFLHHMSN